MDELLEVLEDLKPDVDFKNCKTLIDDAVLDSFDIISIVSELKSEFDVDITVADIVPENFNSAEAMYKMIKRLQDND